MPGSHFAVENYKGGGSDAAGRWRYITRADERALSLKARESPHELSAEERVDHLTKRQGTDRQREDLVHTESGNMPAWVQPGHEAEFFIAAETYTSPHQNAYTEWIISLPRDLQTREQRLDAAADLMHAAFGEKHPFTMAVHDAKAQDGDRNVHIHVMFCDRTIDGIERTPEQFFRSPNAKIPGASKDREFSHVGAVKQHRIMISDVLNVHLERAGVERRLHPDSLEARGFDRGPEPRLDPSDSYAYKTSGTVTERMAEVQHHRAYQRTSEREEAHDARDYWQERSHALGLTREMSGWEQLSRIREARAQAVVRRPERGWTRDQLEERSRDLTHEVEELTQRHEALTWEYGVEVMNQRVGRQRLTASERRVEEVLTRAGDPEARQQVQERDDRAQRWERSRQVERPGRSLQQRLRELGAALAHDEPVQGAGVRVRLHDREREDDRGHDHDRGMGF